MAKIRLIHWVLLVFSAVSVIHILTKFHPILWDEAVYIGIGKYIFSFGKTGLFEVIRPLGLPLIMGFLWFIGLKQIFVYDLLILFFSLGNIYLVYFIGKKLFGESEGLIASVILSITPVFFYNSFEIMTEIPSAFFILMAVYFYLEKRFFPAGLFAGAAFMFKFTNGILLPIIVIILLANFYKKPRMFFRKFSILMAGFVLAVSPYFVFNQVSYGDPIKPLFLASLHQYNPVHEVNDQILNMFYYPAYLFWDNMLLAFSVFSLYYAFKDRKVGLILLFAVLYLVAFTYVPNKQLRFALTFLPFLSLLASSGVVNLSKSIIKIKHGNWLYAILALLLLLASWNSIYKDFHEFNSYPIEKPEIVGEYYEYFDGFGGLILTTDPVPVAYSDIRMIPYYNNITDAHEIYDRYLNESDYVTYSNDTFPCFDQECEKLKEQLWEKVTRNELVFNKTYEETKYIFRVRKTGA